MTSALATDDAIARRLPLIHRALRSRRIPGGDVEDLAQEVALAALLSLRQGRFKPSGEMPVEAAIGHFLYGIARRTVGRYFGRACNRSEMLSGAAPDLAVDPGSTPEEQAIAAEAARAIQRLPRCYREVLTLTAFGLRAAEVAAELGLRERNVVSRLRIGRGLLERALTRGGTRQVPHAGNRVGVGAARGGSETRGGPWVPTRGARTNPRPGHSEG